MSGVEERRIQGFGGENLKEKDHLGDPSIDERIILRWIFRKWDVGCIDWIELTRDRERWWALVSAVMKLRVPLKCGEFLD